MGAVVADFDGGDREAGTPEGARLGAEDFDEDGARLAVLEIREGLNSSVAMTMREAVEDVADGVDARFGRGGGELGADAL